MIDAGNNFNQAKPVTVRPKATNYGDRIGGTDPEDFYRVRLKQRSRLTIKITGLRANANLELLQDRNSDGQVDPGEGVASSRAPNRQTDFIDIEGITAGTYFVRVFPKDDGETTYRLSLAAQSTSKTSFTYEVIRRTNAIRQSRGILPLAVNTQLTQAAQDYAKSMATQDFFSHTGADGSTWQRRIQAKGYNFSDAAENLAIGHKTPASVVNGWMNSSGHRYNMLADQVQEIGVGYFYLANDSGRVRSNHYWAESFGTPAGSGNGGSSDPIDQDHSSPHMDSFFDKLDS
ncbi:MAG: hypothetical protein HC769_09025 [Cyanobacteria bacterium CRU_2_1]|nr:hypothetical protein [Cyanobacteria bacterium RU_5_0]NJR58978.1 hypothetical protein [Cyanobacteria bacterium CRU_2_1]